MIQCLEHVLLNSKTMLDLFPFLPLTLSLLCVFSRMRKTVTLMIALRCPCNIGSHQTDHEEWSSHKIALHNPTTKHMCDVHNLYITQSVTMIDENSALRPNMQQHNNNEGWKPVSPSHLSRPCGARWGTLGLQAIAMRAQLRYQYQRYFMGGEGAWEHVNTCLTHSSNWTRAHNHVMTTLESVCNASSVPILGDPDL